MSYLTDIADLLITNFAELNENNVFVDKIAEADSVAVFLLEEVNDVIYNSIGSFPQEIENRNMKILVRSKNPYDNIEPLNLSESIMKFLNVSANITSPIIASIWANSNNFQAGQDERERFLYQIDFKIIKEC